MVAGMERAGIRPSGRGSLLDVHVQRIIQRDGVDDNYQAMEIGDGVIASVALCISRHVGADQVVDQLPALGKTLGV